MTPRRSLMAAALVVLLLAAVFGWIVTRDTGAPPPLRRPRSADAPARLVDEQPLRTARAMAALAAGEDERRLADQIAQLADDEVDLAYRDALREATHFTPTSEDQALLARMSQDASQVASDHALVASLKQRVGAAKGVRQEDVQDQLDLAQAQAELDEDELNDAHAEVIRSGADPGSLIQQQFDEHQGVERVPERPSPQAATTSGGVSERSGSLMAQLATWRAHGRRADQLQPARLQAALAAEGLARQRDSLQARVTDAKARALARRPGAPPTAGSAAPATPDRTVITALHRLSDDERTLADLTTRIQDERAQQDGYASWIALIRARQRAAAHGMIQSALGILLIVIAVWLFNLVIDGYLARLDATRTRLQTLRGVIHSTAQGLGALLILLVVFGVPSQFGTLLGLAGAGLTIALKDFVLAFFGWFVLMGRHGLRVGDWVEINGVAGEVVEINLLRTVLLETGSGVVTGQPTGRKVAFMNSFAIEGHFFNFTTSGQWLWDELQVSLPPQQDPYPLLDGIRAALAREVEADARTAEKEWQSATAGYKVRAVSPAPAVSLFPTNAGLEVHVRYIARAPERPAIRARLNQALVELLHGRPAEGATGKPAVQPLP